MVDVAGKPRPSFALIDCNNCFASVEVLFRPELRGRPVVVLSNNDGCIIARSQEAKALGLKMGEPYFKVRAFLEEHGVVSFSSNYTLYGEVTARVQDTIAGMVPSVEKYSIGGRASSRVTSRHFDHGRSSRVFISRSNRPYGLTCSQISGVRAA